jgi:hypothetical protein
MCKIFSGPTIIMLDSNGDVFIDSLHKDHECVQKMLTSGAHCDRHSASVKKITSA